MTKELNSPVLLIAFNRPETTFLVFEQIKIAKPKKLFIALDAPRPNIIEDYKNCLLVKEIVSNVDWDCEVHYNLADENQGCGPGPYNAISWVFKTEEQAIILEDDCVPANSFFYYCDELLNRFKHDTRIWLISGNQYNEEAVHTSHSYFFSKYGHSWGWATWKRCWTHMDMEMSKLPLVFEQKLFNSIYRTKKEAKFFKKKFEKTYYNKERMTHIWDVQFAFALSINSHICIVPSKNLVKNIGYFGTHIKSENDFINRKVDESYKILTHPDFIIVDSEYDNYHFKHHWKMNKSLFKYLLRTLKRLYNKF